MDGSAISSELQVTVRRAVRTFLGLDESAANVVALVSCGKAKKSYRTSAEDLYESPLFRRSLAVAKALGDSIFILSAKHGLVPLEKKLAPYDLTLSSLNDAQKSRWAASVMEDLEAVLTTGTTVVAFAGESYTEHLRFLLLQRGYPLIEPLSGMGLGVRGGFLKKVAHIEERVLALKRLYRALENRYADGSIVTLPELLARADLPRRGLYLFFDPSERTPFSSVVPRIVRIGTHGVSEGSKSTLRQRLRTHLGTGDLAGNHRSSVFRLHIGQALLSKHKKKLSTWAKGQSAEAEVRAREASLERQVSEYMRQLLVLVVELDDASGPVSIRARMERALISLFTENGISIDPATENWLGRHSPKPEIASSGIWNIQHNSQDFDARSVDRFTSLVSVSGKGSLL